MITGDSRETALSISAMLGLEELNGQVLCGQGGNSTEKLSTVSISIL